MADTDGSLSEYERQRRANIERNEALIRELELAGLSAELGPVTTSASKRQPAHKPRPPAKKAKVPKKEESPAPRRTSARLAGLQAESELARVKAEEDYVAVQEKAKAERQRVGGDIKFEDLASDALAKLWTFDEDIDTQNEEKVIAGDIVQLRKDLSGLELFEKFEPNDIKITPERIYPIGFHPSVSKRLVLAGDKIGHLGVWDVDQVVSEDDEEYPQLYLFKVHARTISSFNFAPSVSEKVYTSSYDGSIRSVDFTTGISSEIYYGTLSGEPDAVSEIHFADQNLLYFSTLDGEVGRLDLRTPKDIIKYRLHEKKIGGFSLHPSAPHLCATASLDRSMKLWDFRKIKHARSHELQAKCLATYESRLSISCTSWNSDGGIVCNGYDDTINIFNLKDSAAWSESFTGPDELKPSRTIRHNCQTGRWVTILRAHWQQNPLDQVQKFVIGNMNRFMDVYTADGIQLARLGDANLVSAVPAACQFHPTKNWIVGGTASGKVCLYS
ncbi:WD40-repeat-containing domain protein [Lipomyces kononenkoae]|uniref:WD40-repeat-containing domain protein n=1 Tax=Lipomyces kononenkoae TaxID=34357 RepID=A0ACC3TAK7_LIPKO